MVWTLRQLTHLELCLCKGCFTGISMYTAALPHDCCDVMSISVRKTHKCVIKMNEHVCVEPGDVLGVCVSLQGFAQETRARRESQEEEESGPTPSFMKPAHHTESPSPQMTPCPSSSYSSCSTSSCSSSLALEPQHLLLCLASFLRSFLFVSLLCYPSVPWVLCYTTPSTMLGSGTVWYS